MSIRTILSFIFSIVVTAFVAQHNSQSAYAHNMPKNILKKSKTELDLQKYSFAGELFPYYNKKHLRLYKSYERTFTQKNQETVNLVRKADRAFKVIEPILKKYGIPDDFKYLAITESNLDKTQVSPMSAAGIWQLMPSTAKQMGLEVNDEVDERLNLVKSTEAICRLIKYDKRFFGSWTEALVAFNMGSGALIKFEHAQKNYTDVYTLKMFRESTHSIYKVMAYKHLFENLEQYGYKGFKAKKLSLKKIVINKTVNDFVLHSEQYQYNYDSMRLYNAWLLGKKLTVATNKSYVIHVPAK